MTTLDSVLSQACDAMAHKTCGGYANGTKCACGCHLSLAERRQAGRTMRHASPRAKAEPKPRAPRRRAPEKASPPVDTRATQPEPERATFPPGTMTIYAPAGPGTHAFHLRSLETGEQAILVTTPINIRKRPLSVAAAQHRRKA